MKEKFHLKALSLFSNVGVAEAYFESLGVDVVIANELVEERAKFYMHLYPNTNMIVGDITNPVIYNEILESSLKAKIDLIIATPPCQGMSCAGLMDPCDPRNNLIYYAVELIKKLEPKFVILENVPNQMHTHINYLDTQILIPEYVEKELSHIYKFNDKRIINTKDFGVPQSRQRFIYLLSHKNTNIQWEFPSQERVITLREAIGNLPSLDPNIRDEDKKNLFPNYESLKNEGLKVSKWHYPPIHSWKQVEWMMHTPSGKSAFSNEVFYPKKDNRRIKGAPRTYMRMDWGKPATTVMQNSGVISAFSTVHPGRPIIESDSDVKRIYSDARALSIYELLIVSSLPPDWNIPEWASDTLIRKVIGEGIPPLLLKKAIDNLKKIYVCA